MPHKAGDELRVRQLFVSPYALQPIASLGAHAVSRPREGLLLKVEFENESVGYADVHPWTELGDLPVSRQVDALAEGRPTKLALRSLALAKLDANARASKASAFAGLEVPPSHALFTETSRLTSGDLDKVVTEGFKTLKLKVGRDLAAERQVLEIFFGEGSLNPHKGDLDLRLDFNSYHDVTVVREWLLSLSVDLRSAIEFCEDPTGWRLETWQDLSIKTGLRFAVDRESEEVFNENSSAPYGVVIKPAVQNPASFKNSSPKVFVTSYLDHPVGQMGAALEAARLSKRVSVGTCGLLSQSAYEPNDYSLRIPSRGPDLNPSSDELGIGFAELLEKENWQAV